VAVADSGWTGRPVNLNCVIGILAACRFLREHHSLRFSEWRVNPPAENVEFFGVALEVVRIGDSKPAVVSTPAASPNAWTKAVASVARAENSARTGAYQDFLQLVIDELREKHKFTNSRLAQPRHFYPLAAAASPASFTCGIRERGAAGRRVRH
jgi:hypothetical protein